MKEEENKNPKNKIVCDHCGKKNEKNEIIKLKLKNKKLLNFCKNCIDKIYDKVHFEETAKYNLDDRTFVGYEISDERYNKITKKRAGKEKRRRNKEKI